MTNETPPPSESSEELGPGIWIERPDLEFTFVRASGPGGQAVNKLSTAAQLRVAVSAIRGLDDAARARLRELAGNRLTRGDEMIFNARASRSQLDNRDACIDRLRRLVRQAAVPPKPRKRKKPTRAMIERRLEAKRRQAEKKRGRGRPEG
jgi:ribosome-associated protein